MFLENGDVDSKGNMIWSHSPVRMDGMIVMFQRFQPKEHKIDYQVWILMIVQIPSRNLFSKSGQF